MPSPVCLISLPLWATRASRTILLWVRTTFCAPSSPSDWVSAVEPTISVNMTVMICCFSSFFFGLFHSASALANGLSVALSSPSRPVFMAARPAWNICM